MSTMTISKPVFRMKVSAYDDELWCFFMSCTFVSNILCIFELLFFSLFPYFVGYDQVRLIFWKLKYIAMKSVVSTGIQLTNNP